MKSKLFAMVAKESDNAIPEEGSVQEVTENTGEAANVDGAPSVPEPAPAEPVPEEAVDPEQQEQVEQEHNEAIEETVQAADTIAKIKITLESFLEQTQRDDTDAQTRAVINITLGGIQEDMGTEEVPVPATESLSAWKGQTQATIERLIQDANRGLQAANESLWEKIKLKLGVFNAVIADASKQLQAVTFVGAADTDTVEVQMKDFPHLFIFDEGAASFRKATLASMGAVDNALQLAQQLHADKAGKSDLNQKFKQFYPSTAAKADSGGLEMDLALGTSTNAIVGSLSNVDTAYALTTSVKPRNTIEGTAVVKVRDIKEMIARARSSCDALAPTLVAVRTTADKCQKEATGTGSPFNGVCQGLLASCAGVLTKHQIACYQQLLTLVKTTAKATS